MTASDAAAGSPSPNVWALWLLDGDTPARAMLRLLARRPDGRRTDSGTAPQRNGVRQALRVELHREFTLFKAVVDAGADSVMSSYNSVNGAPPVVDSGTWRT
jgi:hypothetical protein